VPLAMMFYAIFIRIGNYGLTVRRYFVVALGIWVLFNMIYLIMSQKKVNQVIVLSAIIVMVLSMYGPLGAYPMSIWHQNTRFESLLNENHMLVDGSIVKNVTINKEQKEEIINQLEYFDRQHELSDLKVLPKDFDLSKDTKEIFGFEYTGYSHYDYGRYYSAWRDVSADLISIKDYDYLIEGSWNKYNNESFRVELLALDSGDFQLTFDDKLLGQIPLSKWVQKNVGDENRQILTLEQATIEPEGMQSIKMIIKNINGEYDKETAVFRLESIEFILLY
jgi:hypothetical protein